MGEVSGSSTVPVHPDELDHLPLVQRRNLLLASLKSSASSGRDGGGFHTQRDQCPASVAAVKVEHSGIQTGSLGDGMDGSSLRSEQLLQENSVNADEFSDLDHISLKDRLRKLLSRNSLKSDPSFKKNVMDSNSDDEADCLLGRANGFSPPPVKDLFKVKAEPLENTNSCQQESNGLGSTSFPATIKTELDTPDDSYLDHMKFRERMNLLKQEKYSESDAPECSVSANKYFPSAYGNSLTLPKVSRQRGQPRKRRKTATDSIETALEEDAPGLLQVLVEQGISVDEMKLYGENDIDEPIDESLIEDSFRELKAVISKLFLQRNSLLKLAPIRCTKGTKPSYCLTCLFSLVEQARYLQFRNWPAEWGWCRDLQSFIFVFERHNRIVLERPEYGYATYFFELVHSLPIDWQIKRLVTTMKLTICGRITLIENKALSVGEDITEGEAQVLMQFGWMPNSGLGTMLKYCDRVVHDRQNEKDNTEWRSKIGKLLMDGFNGGRRVSNSFPLNLLAYRDDQSSQMKMEI